MPEQAKQGESSNSRIQDIVELVKRLCMALTNVEMFSADHPLARKSIDSSYEWLAGIIKRRNEPVVVTITGRNIVIDGMPLEDKNPLVNKLAKKFEDVHVSNLFFEKDVTSDEFVEFFRIIGRGPRYVDEHGGLPKLMTESRIERIRLRDISYVMVTGDEKVVSKDARVVDGNATVISADSEIAQYMVGKVLQRAEEQKWLLNEMKNNPQKMADLIVDGIELASSRAEMGVQDQDGSVEALLNNIRMIGQNLVDDSTGDIKEGEGDLEKALVNLETEVRLRSSKLMSSKVASGFINEIMGVVTSYADRVRAKQVSDEFLKGETSLKKTEDLFKKFAPKQEPVDKFLHQVRERLSKKGVTEDEINKMVDGMGKGDKPRAAPKKPAKPRKNYSQAVADGVSKRLKDLNLDSVKSQEVTESLSSFIEDRAREKAGEFKAEAETLRVDAMRKSKVLDVVPIGIILWNAQGKSDFVNSAARDALKSEGIELSHGLKRCLIEWKFPLEDVPDLAKESDLSESDLKFLLSVARVVKDAGGEVIGVALLPAK